MNMRIAGTIGAIALLFATGGCEFLKEHVKVRSDDRSPGDDRRFVGAEAQRDQAPARDPWRDQR